MKKVITTILTMLAGVSAFAITQQQLSDFEAAVQTGVQGSGDQFVATTTSVAQTAIAQTVAVWAIENPAEYDEWVATRSQRGQIIWTVRRAVNQDFEAFTPQDAIINDFKATFSAVFHDADAYSRFAASGFLVGDKRMSEHAIFLLSLKRYADVDSAFKYVSEKRLAQDFDVLLSAIRRARLSPKAAYELYTKICTDFAEFKETEPKVKANWEALQNDKNEAFMALYAAKKLEALGK